MEKGLFDTYIREVTSYVRFPFDRRAIAKELQAHMEDLYEDLLSQDIDEEQAAQLTVDYMGDSEEVGKELNEVHHPLWGWIWLVTRWMARLCMVVLVGWGIIQGVSFGDTYLQQIEHRNGNVVYTISPVLEAQLYGSEVQIEEILMTVPWNIRIPFGRIHGSAAVWEEAVLVRKFMWEKKSALEMVDCLPAILCFIKKAESGYMMCRRKRIGSYFS